MSVDLGERPRTRDGSVGSSERGAQRGKTVDAPAGSSKGRRWEEEPTTPLECIDLGDPMHRYQPLVLDFLIQRIHFQGT